MPLRARRSCGPDAIHLATAQRLGVDLGRLCTYDDRMRDAAKTLGMAVIAPS